MSPGQIRVLAEEMPRLKAIEALEAGVPDDRLYDVVLAATGSKVAASNAMSQRMADRMRHGE